jgi:hypothetical protein
MAGMQLPFDQCDRIARYFAQDMEEFVRRTHVNLAQMLMLPDEYTHDSQDIIAMLYEDISHMLRDQLIIGIHLLLAECEIDPNTGAYPLRYHVYYSIETTPPSSTSDQEGGLLIPPKRIWHNARFALLLDWNPNTYDQRQYVRRNAYCFDWVAEETRFDATNLVPDKNVGKLTDKNAQVIRKATISPAHHHQ